MIRDRLIPALQERFPSESFAFAEPPEPIASIPARYPALGRVDIYDDGTEATVDIPDVTHGHFSCYDDNLTLDQHEASITADVIDFLEALFADHVLLYRAVNRSSGGWERLDYRPKSEAIRDDREYFLWSRPYQIQ